MMTVNCKMKRIPDSLTDAAEQDPPTILPTHLKLTVAIKVGNGIIALNPKNV